MRRHHSRRASRAFTLIEIMIALALFSIILIAIYSSWNTILKGRLVAERAAASAQRMRITMRTLKDSLLCACMFNANADYYTFTGVSDGDNASLSFVARLPESFPRSGCFGDQGIVRRLTLRTGRRPGFPKAACPAPKSAALESALQGRNGEIPWCWRATSSNSSLSSSIPRVVTGSPNGRTRINFPAKSGSPWPWAARTVTRRADVAMVETIALPSQAIPLQMQLPFGPIGGTPQPNQPTNAAPPVQNNVVQPQ